MKIAIQGHPTRGEEVIQILESLGGINMANLTGFGTFKYYIDPSNKIDITSHFTSDWKIYSLEEFEKEFPFKIGDLCVYQSEYAGDIVVKVLRMIIQDDDIVYEIGHKDTDKTYSGIYRRRDTLKPYKEMKEERNITLTLDKAKEWYHKGGELKEIALQAFSEKELNSLPRSWEEYCRKYGCICLSIRYTNISRKYDVLLKLEQLRDCWRQGNIPQKFKYKIRKVKNEYEVVWGLEDSFLSFCDEQTAKEFLKCFKDLIEKAGDLI